MHLSIFFLHCCVTADAAHPTTKLTTKRNKQIKLGKRSMVHGTGIKRRGETYKLKTEKSKNKIQQKNKM